MGSRIIFFGMMCLIADVTSAEDVSDCTDSIEIVLEARRTESSQVRVNIWGNWDEQRNVYLTTVQAKILRDEELVIQFPIFVHDGSNAFAYPFVVSMDSVEGLEISLIYAKGGENRIIEVKAEAILALVEQGEKRYCL